MQLRSIYNSYFVQLEQWKTYYDYQYEEEFIEIKRQVAEIIHQYTHFTLDLIQQYSEPISTDSRNGTGRPSHGT